MLMPKRTKYLRPHRVSYEGKRLKVINRNYKMVHFGAYRQLKAHKLRIDK